MTDIRDIKNLTSAELIKLCAELRNTIIKQVAAKGGHLSSNLGVIELTVALHIVFDTSKDRLIFDVGHQCYAHKLLTGRSDSFHTLRQFGGIAGFTKPSESVHDATISGHASTSISTALGMARARKLQGENYDIVALIGDGSLTGGVAYEALSDAGHSGLPIVVVLNDNEMSITKNVGGMARYLARLRTGKAYFSLKRTYHRLMRVLPGGRGLDRFLSTIKTVVKETIFPSSLFESMGFKYFGPVDGHDIHTLIRVLRYAREQKKPALVHVCTVKGKGCDYAERDPSAYHGVSGFSLENGELPCAQDSFSSVMGQTVSELAASDTRICAVTAAMGDATGLDGFMSEYPERFFDVGIAEQHAVAMAAGMAKQGMRPLCAIYSTFFQRSYDQLIHDVAIEGLPVVFAVDRAGLVGQDGETHHGLFDVGYLNQIPGLTVLSPSSYAELRNALKWAFTQQSPVAIRYPRGGEGDYTDLHPETAVLRDGSDITLVTYGVTVNQVLEAAEILASRGVSARIVKLCKLTPLDADSIAELLTPDVLVIEEAYTGGGLSERLLAALAVRQKTPKRAAMLTAGSEFVTHGSIEQLRELLGLNASGIARTACCLIGVHYE